MGIFGNQASANPIRNYNFYKELIEIKFIPDSISLFKIMENVTISLNVEKKYNDYLFRPRAYIISSFKS